MKKFLLMSLAVLVCFGAVCGCGKKDKEDDKAGEKDKTEEKVGLGPFELKAGDIKEQMITKSIKLTNTKFNVDDTGTSYVTDITNTSKEDVKVYELHIIIKNQDGIEMVRFRANLNDLKAGEMKSIKTGMDFKLEGFKTVQYEIIESKPAE